MSANVRRLCVGIDWGTHSSKWWYVAQTSTGKRIEPSQLPSVIDSTIYRTASNLTIHRERARKRPEVADARLKRLLLKDPQGASYWEATREGIGISLGEAATLTIGCMFGDMFQSLKEATLRIDSTAEIEVRFSLPNWIGNDSEHAAARRRMYQTSVVSVALVKSLGQGKLPILGTKINISEWREMIKALRHDAEVCKLLENNPSDFGNMVEDEYSLGTFKWRLAAESSAAGFIPLGHLLADVPKGAKSQKHWVKLLVIDVGAGSTDAGYFISSRRLDDGELLLNYLPPARTFDYAGEQLTEMLQDFYVREHNRDLSIEEAEIMKVSAPERWQGPVTGVQTCALPISNSL